MSGECLRHDRTKLKYNYLVIGGGETPRMDFLKKLAGQCMNVVTVDRGATTALRMGAGVDLHVGDDDSIKLKKAHKKTFRPSQRIRLPKQKPISDLEFALELLPSKASKIVVGAHRDHEGRSDHVFVNFLLASTVPRSYFVDANSWIYNIGGKRFSFSAPRGTIFSVIPLGPTHLSITGARYNLKNKKTTRSNPSLGLSNITRSSRIHVSSRGPALLFVNSSFLKASPR